MSVLQVRNLSKQFVPPVYAVHDISFDVKKGEMLGILGANGAGKTTTISMLTGLLTPTAGEIEFFGKNFFKHRSEIMQYVGYGTAYAQLPGMLTIEANLDVFGRIFGLSSAERKARIQMLLEQLGMWSFRKRRAAGLSAGEMTRIILAKAFLGKPQIVLLDEPTASLDVDIAHSIRGFVKEQRKEGVTFIITSHNMQEMTELCDRIIVMEQGNIITSSTPEQLAKTVHKTKLSVWVGEAVHPIVEFAEAKKLPYRVEGPMVELDVDEKEVAATLIEITKRGIEYHDLSIKHPTLEDYFLSLQKKRRKRK